MAKILLSTLQLPAGPIGPEGPVGPPGEPGLDGANVLPTSEAVAQAVTEPGPAKDALSATFVPYVSPVYPSVHGASDAVPVYARRITDANTVGVVNAVHDGALGGILHYTTGPNTSPARIVSDGVTTAGSATITSATAAFSAGSSGIGTDIGARITGPGIPAGATIIAVASASQATISAPATATATGVGLTIGVGNANGAVIAVGVDNGGVGAIIRNKWKGAGLILHQLASVADAGSHALIVDHYSALAPAAKMNLKPGATAPMFRWVADGSNAAAGAIFQEFQDNGISGSLLAGRIRADNGQILWNRTIQVTAAALSHTPLIRIAEEIATPSEVYLSAKTGGETGLKLYRYAGSGTSMYGFGWLAESDRFKLKASQGPAAKGAETYATMIEVRSNAGAGGFGQMGFFGATPSNRRGATPDATDLATAITLVNALKADLVAYGLKAAL